MGHSLLLSTWGGDHKQKRLARPSLSWGSPGFFSCFPFMEQSLGKLFKYDWLFTVSSKGLESFLERCVHLFNEVVAGWWMSPYGSIAHRPAILTTDDLDDWISS